MADDLDQLLDEVESRFCRPASTASESARSSQVTNRNNSTSPVASKLDIDGLIKDIIDDTGFEEHHVKPKAKSSHQSPKGTFSHINSKKCCPVYLGGSSALCGLGTNTSQRTCDRLRCTSCDFLVAIYDDYQWDKSCDYLFFRNSMPEVEKLKRKMIRKKGSRSYACQCSWKSIELLTELQTDPELRWVCGKHSENSMPEVEKLKRKMIRKKGSRSYACQCSWKSIELLTELQTDPELRWVCGKHSKNSMPEVEKLKRKMIRKKGSRSYACQCSWKSIELLTELQTDPELRWVCGKHSE